MSLTLLGAIAAIQDLTTALTGIRVAPDYPPDAVSVFPAAVCYGASGTLGGLGGCTAMEAHHTIYLEIHVARKDLPRDVALLMPYVETVGNAILKDVLLAAAVTGVEPPISWTLLERTWDSAGLVKTLCLRFIIPVKQINVIT